MEQRNWGILRYLLAENVVDVFEAIAKRMKVGVVDYVLDLEREQHEIERNDMNQNVIGEGLEWSLGVDLVRWDFKFYQLAKKAQDVNEEMVWASSL